MDYQRIYDAIISSRRNNPPEGYSENHHIIPRSFGGSNTSENMVRLTAREHFLCHWLLTKIHPSGRLHYKAIHAFVSMAWLHSENQQRYRCTARLYEKLKQEHSALMSRTQQGSRNSQYGTCWVWHELIGSKKIKKNLLPEYIEQGWYKGKNLSFEKMTPDEVRWNRGIEKRRIASTNRVWTKESRQKLSELNKGKVFSTEHKKNLSEGHTGLVGNNAGKVWINDGQRQKLIDINKPIPLNWNRGRL